MNASYDGYDNTVLVPSPYPNATDYYSNITNGWNYTFNSYNWTWSPYLTFGDITSMLYVDDPELYTPSFGIFDESCWDGNIQNCTSVCSDPALLFANSTKSKTGDPEMNLQVPFNVLTCMFYPVLSKLLAEPHSNDSSWQALQAIGQQYNIVPDASPDLIQTIVDTQVNCYTSYCLWQDSTLCLNYDLETGNYQAIKAPGVIPLFPDWSTISSASTFTINSDIGGIGVSISYCIEFSLILFIWLALRIPRFVKWVRATKAARSRGAPIESEVTPETRRRDELIRAIAKHSAKTQERVTELLTDFHQAQCWFFIPLNLTVLLALGGATVVFQIGSFGQLSRNLDYVECICQGGVVFAVATMYFVLFEAHHLEENFEETHKGEDEKSHAHQKGDRHGVNDPKRMIVFWVLTFVSVTLGTVAWYWTFSTKHPERLIAPNAGSPQLQWINYCGLIPPANYNGELWINESTHHPDRRKRLPIVVFNWILILGMFLFFFRAAIARVFNKSRLLQKPVRWISAESVQGWVKHGVLFMVECLLLACLGLFLNDYIIFMRPNLPQISKDFTMGQLLALFVWAPIFVSAFYLGWDWCVAMTRTLIRQRTYDSAHDTTQYIQMSTKTDVPIPAREIHHTDTGFSSVSGFQP